MVAGMGGQPSLDPRVFVGGVVVDYQMDVELARHILLHVLKKGEIVLMTMPAFTSGQDVPGGDVQRQTGWWFRDAHSHGLRLPRSPDPSAAWVGCDLSKRQVFCDARTLATCIRYSRMCVVLDLQDNFGDGV